MPASTRALTPTAISKVDRRGRTGVVLIVTHGQDDDHAERVMSAVAEQGGTPVRFDTDTYPARSTVTFTDRSGGPEVGLRLNGHLVPGRDITAILYRHRWLPRAPAGTEPAAVGMVESELRALLDGALLSLDAFWINHPATSGLARHKPLQLALARAEGFEVPETCITADPTVVRELWTEWGGRMVAKLVGGQVLERPGEEPYAVFTTRLEAADLQDDASIAACPAIYQRELDKVCDVRVTVVGEQVFACSIPSQESENGTVDWRRAGRAALAPAPFSLDGASAQLCRSLTSRLGLEVAGVDLVLTPDRRLVFLEINASGQWAWVEEATGMPIAATIARRLLDGGSRRAAGQRPAVAGFSGAFPQ